MLAVIEKRGVIFKFFGFLFPMLILAVMLQYHLGRGHIGVSMKSNLFHLLEQRAVSW